MNTTTIKERPILMSGPMVRAILAGTKSQTRRVVKPQPLCYSHKDWPESPDFYPSFNKDGSLCCGICMGQQQRLTKKDVTGIRNPYGKPGDRLWVRESFGYCNDEPMFGAFYRAEELVQKDYAEENGIPRWRPSIHMPRWACRLELEIVAVRLERLQDISEADCIAEGIERDAAEFKNYNSKDTAFEWLGGVGAAKLSYSTLWESINGPKSWEENPWVWVVEFKRVK